MPGRHFLIIYSKSKTEVKRSAVSYHFLRFSATRSNSKKDRFPENRKPVFFIHDQINKAFWSFAAISVFFINIEMVIGPTPPGTGVM